MELRAAGLPNPLRRQTPAVRPEPLPTSYRRITVEDDGGCSVRYILPVPERDAPPWATRVSQSPRLDWRPSDSPLFATPIPFVIPPPPGSGEPFYRHNHCPSIAWLPNGDLLAVWFSTIWEEGLEMTVLASRLRAGSQAWEPASEFFKAADRNMTGSSLFFDEHTGVLHHLNGMGRAGVEGWTDLVLMHRQSLDNGTTWTVARPVSSGGRYQLRNQPVAGLVRTRDGSLLQCCDATDGGEGDTAIHVSRDGGRTWNETGGNIRGIHAGLVELANGSWLAFGRGRDIDGRMPQSVSGDGGRTWRHAAGPFPGIGPAQRFALLRLREGPLLLVSFTMGAGLFAALSDDDGRTWPARRLLSPGDASFAVGPYFGAKVARPPVVTTTPTQGEREGYLAATQTPDGVIHLLSSRLHYRFNLPWLRTKTYPCEDIEQI